MTCPACNLMTLLRSRIDASSLAPTVSAQLAASGAVPTFKPRPVGLTDLQNLCLDIAELLYLYALNDCLGLDPQAQKQCIQDAFDEYCNNFDSCVTV